MKNQRKAVSVRPYDNADYDQVKQILEESSLFYEPMDSQERLKEKTSRDPRSVFVATQPDGIVGTISIMEDGRMAFVFRLCVKKESRNEGIGTMLMDYAEKELFDRGYPEVHILVEQEKTKLQEYYEKLGFEKGHTYTWMAKERK